MTLSKISNHITNPPKKLSVQISLTGLSFLVLTEDEKVASYFSVTFSEKLPPQAVLEEIKKQLTKYHISLTTIESVTLIYAIPLSTLVPLPLFDVNKKSEYLKFNSKILATDYIAHDELPNLKMATVYIPYVNINNYFVENCNNVTYYHSNTLVINHIVTKRKLDQATEVILYIQPQQIDIFVVVKGKLELANAFEFVTPEDFIYYILFVMEQLHLKPEEVKTSLIGEITEESELFEIAYKYIRNIEISNLDEWGTQHVNDPSYVVHHLV